MAAFGKARIRLSLVALLLLVGAVGALLGMVGRAVYSRTTYLYSRESRQYSSQHGTFQALHTATQGRTRLKYLILIPKGASYSLVGDPHNSPANAATEDRSSSPSQLNVIPEIVFNRDEIYQDQRRINTDQHLVYILGFDQVLRPADLPNHLIRDWQPHTELTSSKAWPHLERLLQEELARRQDAMADE